MHNRRRVLLIILVLAFIAVAAGTALTRSRPDAANGGLIASGTIEATETNVSAKLGGRIAEIRVREGDFVQAGDVLATLDRRELDAEVLRAEGALESAEAALRDLQRGSREEQIAAARARLKQAEAACAGAEEQLGLATEGREKVTELKQQVDSAEAGLAAARAALEVAIARRDEARNGPRPQEVARAEAQLEGARSSSQGARQAHVDASDLHSLLQRFEGPVIEARTLRDTAREGLRIAEEQESLMRAGAREEKIAQTEANLEAADANLDSAKTRYDRMKDLRSADAVTQQEFDDAEALYRAAVAKQRAAREALAEIRAGARAQEIRAAELTTEKARAALAGAERAVEEAEKALDQQRLAARQGMNTADAQVRTATAGERAAAASLGLVREGTREEVIAQAEAVVRQAEANVRGAETALANAQQAYDDRLEASGRVTEARTSLEIARAQREAARAELALLEAGATEEAIENARGMVKQTRAALERARIAREEASITAPVSGTITDVIAEVGEVVAAGATVLTMTDLASMWLKVYLPMTELGAAMIGNAVVVTTDAAPDRTFPGEILTISNTAEFTPKNVQTQAQRVQQVFWVKVGVGDGNGVLKPGMPADARFD